MAVTPVCEEYIAHLESSGPDQEWTWETGHACPIMLIVKLGVCLPVEHVVVNMLFTA